MCFSFPMMFELIPFDCSRMVLLGEASAKWINFDYLSLTSFDFSKKSTLDHCLLLVRGIFAIIVPYIFATAIFTFN